LIQRGQKYILMLDQAKFFSGSSLKKFSDIF